MAKAKKRTHQFINRDIIAGLILALTKRERPTDEELNNDTSQIVLWNRLYDTAELLKKLGFSENMPFEWLQQELAIVQRPNFDNPNVTYPDTIKPLFESLDKLIENIDEYTKDLD